jgi:hypothetical protein
MRALTSGRLVVVLAVVGVAGLLLLIAADRYERPQLIGPGLLLFAAGTFAAGVDAIRRKHSVDRNSRTTKRQTFQGPAAVLIGLLLVLMSLCLTVAGVGFVLGAEERLLAFLKERPGFALLAIGSVSGAGGGARVLGAREWRGSAGRFLASIPERFSGILLLLFGLALFAIGMFEIAAPAAFDRALDALLAPLRTAA